MRKTEIFDRHATVQRTGAVNFQSIAEKVNLNGRALGVNTVIAVNKRIQHGFAYRADRIFGFVTSLAGF